MDISEIKRVCEALLFAAEGPLKLERLIEILDAERGAVQQAVRELLADSAAAGQAFVLCEVADGFQYRTRPEYAEWLRRANRGRPFRFSRAALESLAIVAYRQPVTRAEVEYLRGVDSGGVLKTLMEKRLVRILGKKEIAGRPLIYGTTREFLEFFGLRDLTGLPALREFSELTPGSLIAPSGDDDAVASEDELAP